MNEYSYLNLITVNFFWRYQTHFLANIKSGMCQTVYKIVILT